MSKNVCVCRSCVDPRENGLYIQHGLPLYNGIYMARKKGAFIPKYGPVNDFSTTMSMLIDLGKEPTVVVQGHRDCAAVKVLFDTFGRPDDELNVTEKEFRHSHDEALQTVKKIAAALSDGDQLRILEKICVLQSINNFFEYCDAMKDKTGAKHPPMFACFSQTPTTPVGENFDPQNIELLIFDPKRNKFIASPDGDNEGCRIVDLIDTKTFLPQTSQLFSISEPINLAAVVRNEVGRRTPRSRKPLVTPEESSFPFCLAAQAATINPHHHQNHLG